MIRATVDVVRGDEIHPPRVTFGHKPKECDVCGSQPFDGFRFRRITGRGIRCDVVVEQGTWCRQCALTIGRDAQGHTMLRGWFAPLGVPLSLFWGAINAIRLIEARRLRRAANERSLVPGRTVLLRLGMVPTAIVFALLSFIPIDWTADRPNEAARVFVGQCVDLPWFPWLTRPFVVACGSATPEAYVFHKGVVPTAPAYPGDRTVDDYVEAECEARFERFLDSSRWGRDANLKRYAPRRSHWPNERQFACLAVFD